MKINRCLYLIVMSFALFAQGQIVSENSWLSDPVVRVDAQGGPLGDAMPTVIYDANAGPKTWQMWWFGTRGNEADLPLPGVSNDYHGQSDRIFYSSSADGVNWSPTQIVLRGRLGSSSFDAGDDHMVGSPSVLRISNTYYMFYEAYGNWIVPLNLFYNAVHGDTWLQPGVNVVGDASGTRSNYLFTRDLGFAPRFRKYGTHPVYGGLVTYPNGEINHFIYSEQNIPAFEYTVLNDGLPLFWLFDEEHKPTGVNAKPIYTIWAGSSWDTGVKDDPADHPTLPVVEFLGYSYANLDTPETLGVMQNKVHMATSADGVNWNRFNGPGTGGAVANPLDERTTDYQPQQNGDLNQSQFHASWDLIQNYGAGYPSALLKEGNVELFYPDISTGQPFKLSVPQNQLTNSTAWVNARNNSTTVSFNLGGEVAWSDVHQAYFSSFLRQPGHLTPQDAFGPWTFENNTTFIQTPVVTMTPAIAQQDSFLTALPVATSAPGDGAPELFGRVAIWGTFARTPGGQTLDFPNGDGTVTDSYTAFHHFYTSVDRELMVSPGHVANFAHYTEISHSLEFIYWPVDSDEDGVFDNMDNCTSFQNPDQRDTNNDGYGNICDPDLNNDGIVNFADVSLWTQFFNTATNGDADFNGDGFANFGDYALFPIFFLRSPGPSGLAP